MSVVRNKGGYLADFGKVLNGMLDVTLPCLPEGHVTPVGYGDNTPDKMDPLICGTDTLISSGAAEGDRFVNRFNHHVFRYVQLDSLSEEPLAIRAYRMRTDYPKRSTFECSDQDLNRIYSLVDWTVENLSFNGYMVDCASIERLGYGGDGNASTLTFQSMAAVSPLFLNWLQPGPIPSALTAACPIRPPTRTGPAAGPTGAVSWCRLPGAPM